MNRPKKNEQDKRKKKLRIGVNDEEELIIQAEAEREGMTVSAYVRKRLLGAVPEKRKANPYRASIIRGLGEVGHILHILRQGKVEQSVIGKLVELSENLIKELSDGHTR
jgi:hypothetical protein